MNSFNNKPRISHAIIPAAGRGTRFLPFTKAVPKELLPILNIPAIQHVVQEAQQAHITHCHIVTHPTKDALKRYFSPDTTLDELLAHDPKKALLSQLTKLIQEVTFSFPVQYEQKGLGHAILMAHEAISDDFFTVLLPDDLLIGAQPAIGSLISVAQQYNASVIAVQKVAKESLSSYGVINIQQQIAPNLFSIKDLVEKPRPDQAPSEYGIIGRYVLSSNIFQALKTVTPGSGGEIQLTDAIKKLVLEGHPVIACVIPQERFDLGSPDGWIRANIHHALQDPTLQKNLLDFLRKNDQ